MADQRETGESSSTPERYVEIPQPSDVAYYCNSRWDNACYNRVVWQRQVGYHEATNLPLPCDSVSACHCRLSTPAIAVICCGWPRQRLQTAPQSAEDSQGKLTTLREQTASQSAQVKAHRLEDRQQQTAIPL